MALIPSVAVEYHYLCEAVIFSICKSWCSQVFQTLAWCLLHFFLRAAEEWYSSLKDCPSVRPITLARRKYSPAPLLPPESQFFHGPFPGFGYWTCQPGASAQSCPPDAIFHWQQGAYLLLLIWQWGLEHILPDNHMYDQKGPPPLCSFMFTL